MNPFAHMLFGWTAGIGQGRNIVEVTVPQILPGQVEEMMQALRSGKSWHSEFIVHRRDGATFLAAVTDTPIRDEQENLCAIIAAYEDISWWHQTVQALSEIVG